MSAREGFTVSVQDPCPRTPWDGGPERLQDPRSQQPRITVEIRAHWPMWATESEVRAAMVRAVADAAAQLDRRARR